ICRVMPLTPARPAVKPRCGPSSAQRPERRPDLGREQLGLLPGGEVAALVDLVEVGEVGVDLLGPAARGPRWQSRSIPGRRAASSSWRMAAKASSVAAGG